MWPLRLKGYVTDENNKCGDETGKEDVFGSVCECECECEKIDKLEGYL